MAALTRSSFTVFRRLVRKGVSFYSSLAGVGLCVKVSLCCVTVSEVTLIPTRDRLLLLLAKEANSKTVSVS